MRLLTLLSTVAFLLIVVASCKDKDNDQIVVSEKGEPAISIKVPGLTITDNVLHVSVTKDSTITIDYTATASAMIQQFIQSIDGNEEMIQEAIGLEEYTGQLIVDVPFEEKTIAVKFEVKDTHDQVVTEAFSIVVEEIVTMAEGGSPALAFRIEGFNYDAEIIATTDGSGGFSFGSKIQAAPVLFDEVDKVFENGVRNPVRDNHMQGQAIETIKENPNEVYKDRGGSGPCYFETQENLRVQGRPVFWMPGASNTFHHPAAALESPYPTDGDKTIYVAWHVRSKYDARLYNRYVRDANGVELNESSGFVGPKPGERYGETVSGNGLSGRITGISDKGISFEMIRSSKAPEIGATGFGNNVVVTGETSGASFTTNTKGGESTFQGEGSNKWIRVWSEDGSDPSIRISWTQMHLTSDDVVQYDGSYWNTTSTQMVENWVFMEFFLTPDRLTAKVDGKILHDGDATQLILPPGVKVNIGMIGFNGNSSNTQLTQETHISEIYMDHSVKRFYLANAATIEDATKVELQRPTAWEDNTVKMKARFGNLDPATEKIYLIYSDDIAETAAVAIN